MVDGDIWPSASCCGTRRRIRFSIPLVLHNELINRLSSFVRLPFSYNAGVCRYHVLVPVWARHILLICVTAESFRLTLKLRENENLQDVSSIENVIRGVSANFAGRCLQLTTDSLECCSTSGFGDIGCCRDYENDRSMSIPTVGDCAPRKGIRRCELPWPIGDFGDSGEEHAVRVVSLTLRRTERNS